jgi:hypothetical protein
VGYPVIVNELESVSMALFPAADAIDEFSIPQVLMSVAVTREAISAAMRGSMMMRGQMSQEAQQYTGKCAPLPPP